MDRRLRVGDGVRYPGHLHRSRWGRKEARFRVVQRHAGGGTVGAADDCPDFSPNSFNAAPVSGTIDLVLKSGTIATEVEPGGMVCNTFLGAHIQESAFFLTLEVTGGTHADAGATGTLTLDYSSEVTFFTGNPDGPPQDFGTLTGAIVR